MSTTLAALRRRANKARDFPANTCPASRHLQDMADSLARYGDYPMFEEDPRHCAAPIYASIDPGQFIAVLNDHTLSEAGFRDHRAIFRLQHSQEWTTWTKHAGAGAAFNGNEAFALFIQDNLPDIVSPSPADMLAMALNFRIGETVAFRNAVNLADGNTEFQYDAIVDGSSANAKGSKIKIPGAFSLSLPIWAGLTARKYALNARFRYRLRDGKLALWYELERPHKVVEQAFADLWVQIEKGTKATILHGTPE